MKKNRAWAVVAFGLLIFSAADLRGQSAALPRIAGHIGGDANGLAEQGGVVYWLMGPTLLTGRFDAASEEVVIAGRTGVLPEIPKDIAVAGDFAYVTDAAGLKVLDCSDVARPRLAGSLDLTGSALDVAARDGFAYVASAVLGLRVVDASDPARPTLATEIPMISGAAGVAVQGDRLVVVDGSFGLRFYDLVDPADPRPIGQFVRDGLSGVIAAEGDLLFLGFTDPSNNRTGVLIVDAADPANAVALSSFATGGLPAGIDVSNGYAYAMASGFPQLEVFDVRDPARPVDPIFGGSQLRLRGEPGDVAVVGPLAYLSTGPWGFRVVDVRFPNQLEEVGDYSPAGFPFDVAIRDELAYLATFEGLRIVDWREPSAPSYAGGIDVDGLGLGIAVSGTDVYLGSQDGNQGGRLRLFDAADPLAPVEKVNLRLSGWPYDLEPRGDRLFAATFFGQSLELLKRETAPTNLVPTVRYSRAFLPSSVALREDRAYMLTARFGNADPAFHLLDISDPDTMALISTLDLPGSPFGIDAFGTHAYVAGDQGLTVLDLSDERNPSLGATVAAPSALQAVTIAEGRAYAAAIDDGLIVYDLTDPERPIEIADVDLPGQASRVEVAGIYAFVTSIDGGLYIVQVLPKEEGPADGEGGTGDGGAGGTAGGFGGAIGPAGPGASGGAGGCGCQLEAADSGMKPGDVFIAMGLFLLATWRFLRP
ncbi:MAG TPA: hypothetical protein VFX30_11155 [bacterium]|nr:hypothetical protein [bacterium]